MCIQYPASSIMRERKFPSGEILPLRTFCDVGSGGRVGIPGLAHTIPGRGNALSENNPGLPRLAKAYIPSFVAEDSYYAVAL